VSDRHPQSTLREWRAHISQPLAPALLGGVGLLLGLAGPFETLDHLSIVPRVIYWIWLVAACYSAGFFASSLQPIRHPSWAYITAAGAATGAAVSILVLLTNLIVFQHLPEWRALPEFVATLFAVCWIVTGLLHLLGLHFAPQEQAISLSPPILDRLPFNKRGALVALSVEDHYVRIQTVNGEEMVLMRLGDAIRETGDTDGAQVHRSHWVAWTQVVSAKRKGDRAILTMATGQEIPVSRANLAKIKEAGLLP